ncbi:Hpt domain-containing protein [Roseospira navarrensis]|uniref:Phosphorelay protein n=1 Tax=Roseospira navarrensis TaxID=140058 RepID=A0A7X1ZCN5_9PROT|nr:Hpt domain-containing protein [Roseospira navarrensis]MQX35892.1 phosphorelay protein [Roseospira navarrensis]
MAMMHRKDLDGAGRDAEDATFIAPPDPLSRKVQVTQTGVDAAALARAEAMLAGMHDQYLAWVDKDVSALVLALATMEGDPADPAAAKREVFRIAHDMKGQGGSFGYDLVTRVGNGLCRFLERIGDRPTPEQLQAVRLHVESLQVIVSRRMSGDGGPAGAEMIEGLTRVVDRALS